MVGNNLIQWRLAKLLRGTPYQTLKANRKRKDMYVQSLRPFPPALEQGSTAPKIVRIIFLSVLFECDFDSPGHSTNARLESKISNLGWT